MTAAWVTSCARSAATTAPREARCASHIACSAEGTGGASRSRQISGRSARSKNRVEMRRESCSTRARRKPRRESSRNSRAWRSSAVSWISSSMRCVRGAPSSGGGCDEGCARRRAWSSAMTPWVMASSSAFVDASGS